MGFESYISENEAATLANVGAITLRRFAEAGYFRIETETDGLRLYARSDLERVFGLKPKAVQPTPRAPQTFSNPAPIKKEIITAAKVESAPKDPQAQNADVIETPIAKPIVPVAAPAEPASAAQPPPAVKIETAPHSIPALDALDRDLQRQRTISEMQDRLLAIREDEIRNLKDERDWLRTRIEKLEEKASRDQLLLLSETQTIKALITIQEHRRSPVRLALEWLGFISAAPLEQTPQQRGAIDIGKQDEFQSKKAA